MLHRKALIQALWPVSMALALWSSAATAQPQDNDLLMTLYTQLEALQQEVQTLRGMVEEQSNQLRRVQTEQRDRYLDVDRRLSELTGGAAVGAAGAAGAAGATPPPALPGATAGATNVPQASTAGTTLPPATDPGTPTTPPAVALGNVPPGGGAAVTQTPAPDVSTPAAPAPGAELGEQDLYRTALNLLLEQSQYDESIRMFQAYIDRFPQGRLLTNAYYWQGEALILVSRLDEARDIFMRLINEYPQEPKAASAMLKLGVVYDQMGDRARAEQTWREIATRYPEDLPEIRAAQNYLNRR